MRLTFFDSSIAWKFESIRQWVNWMVGGVRWWQISVVTELTDAVIQHYLTRDCHAHSSVDVWSHYELSELMNKRDSPISEHHQAILIVLVRRERFLQQVDLVAAALKVHVATFPWLIQAECRHLNMTKQSRVSNECDIIAVRKVHANTFRKKNPEAGNHTHTQFVLLGGANVSQISICLLWCNCED